MGVLKNISTIIKYTFYLLIFGLVFFSGFYVGRKTLKVPKPETVIEYVEAEPVHDTLKVPMPVKVSVPADTLDIIRYCINSGKYGELFPKEQVPVYITKEDTTKIMHDWATRREYKEKIFESDTLGKCVIDAEVQYNRLHLLGYEFTPVQRTVTNTVYTTKKYSGFAGLGYSVGLGNEKPINIFEVSGGLYYKDRYGASLKYGRSFADKQDYFGGAVLFKF